MRASLKTPEFPFKIFPVLFHFDVDDAHKITLHDTRIIAYAVLAYTCAVALYDIGFDVMLQKTKGMFLCAHKTVSCSNRPRRHG